MRASYRLVTGDIAEEFGSLGIAIALADNIMSRHPDWIVHISEVTSGRTLLLTDSRGGATARRAELEAALARGTVLENERRIVELRQGLTR